MAKGYRLISQELIETLSPLGIVRTVEKNWYDETIVWYDVCADDGHGAIIKSFKVKESEDVAKFRAFCWALDEARKRNEEG